jgi:archaellin
MDPLEVGKWDYQLTPENFEEFLATLENSGNLPECNNEIPFSWTSAGIAYLWAIATTFKHNREMRFDSSVGADPDNSMKQHEKQIQTMFDKVLPMKVGDEFHSSPAGQPSPGCQVS